MMQMKQLLAALAAEPFLAQLGLEVLSADSTSVILRLRYRPQLSNHAQMLHAGAQFSLGEATAVALVATIFAGHLDTINLLTGQASITYTLPAQGDLTGRATLPRGDAERARREWTQTGRTRLSVGVEVQDETGAVVTMLTVTCVALRRYQAEG
jgi:uncharacterized protein (TIGR00369 family)